MFNNFCAGQELRALMSSKTLPEPIVKQLVPAFQQSFGVRNRGTLLNDMLAFNEKDADIQNSTRLTRLKRGMENRLREKLRHRGLIGDGPHSALGEEVLLQRSITRRGVRFCPKSVSLGDSQVVFGDLPNGRWGAGNIKEIVVWPRRNAGQVEYYTFFIVEELLPLSSQHAGYDTYRAYHTLAGMLWYKRTTESLIAFDDVVCHYACTPRPAGQFSIPHDCVHVLPLDRVSPCIE